MRDLVSESHLWDNLYEMILMIMIMIIMIMIMIIIVMIMIMMTNLLSESQFWDNLYEMILLSDKADPGCQSAVKLRSKTFHRHRMIICFGKYFRERPTKLENISD